MTKIKIVRRISFALIISCFMVGLMTSVAKASDENSSVPSIKQPTIPNQEFNIKDYGANGDGETKNTKAFDNAIEEAHKAGGGKVIVPEGEYLTGAIHLESNIDLHLEENAVIKFSQDPNDYLPTVKTRFEGTELYNYSPMIYAYDKSNIAITGKGTIDGQADNEHWWPWKGKEEFGWKEGEPRQKEDAEKLMKMGQDDVPVEERDFGDGHYLRPNLIQFYQSENILIEGVTINDSPMWHVHPVLSENVTVQGTTIEGHGPNGDGVNPESSKNVLIKNNNFNNGDDNIAIKSGKNADGRRINVPSKNIYIIGNHMKDGHGAVTIGSEMSGGVENVLAKDNVMDSPDLWNILRIKTNTDRGGYAKNINFEDNVAENVKDEVFKINTDYTNDGEETTSEEHIPVVKDINIKNLESNGGEYALKLEGLEQEPVENITITNANFNNVKNDAELKYINDLKLDNVSINGEEIYRLLPSEDAKQMEDIVQRMDENGDISNSETTHLLSTHLISVNQFEKTDQPQKVVKHLKSFNDLLENQRKHEFISEKAYNLLKDDAEHLINKWD